MGDYKLPNISIEQYRLLPADEQYLLISSIHALYERMALGGVPQNLPPLPNNVVPIRAQQAPARAPRTPKRNTPKFYKGSAAAFIVEVMTGAGWLAPKEILKRVSAKTQITETTLWTTLHRLAKRGVLETIDESVRGTPLARYKLKT